MTVAAAPRAAAAQEPKIEAGAGAAVVRDSKNSVNLRGWYAEGSYRIRPGISIVVEGSSTWRTLTIYAGDFAVDRVKLSVDSVMAGARLSTRLWKVREFAQVLAGRLSGSGSDTSFVDVTPHVVVQPGLGLDIPLAQRLALRIELDARYISVDGRGNQNGVQFRLASGFAYALRR